MLSIQAIQKGDKVEIVANYCFPLDVEIVIQNDWCTLSVNGSRTRIDENFPTWYLNHTKSYTSLAKGRECMISKAFPISGDTEIRIARFIEWLKVFESKLKAEIDPIFERYTQNTQKAQNLTNLINTLLAN